MRSTATVNSSRPTAPTDRATGPRAEALAAEFLARHGLTIVARNFRTRYGEIDVIARDGDTLVFVEVRIRRSSRYGGAVESITAAKQSRLVAAAQCYLAGLREAPPCRFDAILMRRLDAATFDWRRDVVHVD